MDSSPDLFASGSDDSFIKVCGGGWFEPLPLRADWIILDLCNPPTFISQLWDRRTIDGSGRCRPVGALVGHTEGITHIDTRWEESLRSRIMG